MCGVRWTYYYASSGQAHLTLYGFSPQLALIHDVRQFWGVAAAGLCGARPGADRLRRRCHAAGVPRPGQADGAAARVPRAGVTWRGTARAWRAAAATRGAGAVRDETARYSSALGQDPSARFGACAGPQGVVLQRHSPCGPPARWERKRQGVASWARDGRHVRGYRRDPQYCRHVRGARAVSGLERSPRRRADSWAAR